MRTRVLFIIVSLTVIFSTEILLGKKGEAPMQLSVRQQVDSEIHNLKRNLEFAKQPEEQWRAFEKAEKQIQSLRAQSPRQFDKDEIYMDTLMASLDEVPRKEYFKKDECDSYRTTILAHFDPKAEDQPSAPVAQALDVLKAVCR